LKLTPIAAAVRSKTVFSCAMSRYWPVESQSCATSRPGERCQMMAMRSGSGYDSGRRISAFATLKTAALAPKAIASDSTAAAVNAGAPASRRRACRTSCRQMSIGPFAGDGE
jgi:hypothetical protein